MSPNDWVLAGVAFSSGGAVGWIGGYCFGYLVAVKHTEERWSEAVGRYEDRQKYANPRCGETKE